MLGQIPVAGSGSMADTANAITRNEQLGFAQLTDLIADPNSTNNLATFMISTVQFGAVSIVPAGTIFPRHSHCHQHEYLRQRGQNRCRRLPSTPITTAGGLPQPRLRFEGILNC